MAGLKGKSGLPRTIHLTKVMASRTLITTADFPKSYPFPLLLSDHS